MLYKFQVVFELLMMDGETAWNMYNIDSNKEYCITLHLVGCIWRNNDVLSHECQILLFYTTNVCRHEYLYE